MDYVPDVQEHYLIIQEQANNRKEHIGTFKNNILSKGKSSKQSLPNQEQYSSTQDSMDHIAFVQKKKLSNRNVLKPKRNQMEPHLKSGQTNPYN